MKVNQFNKLKTKFEDKNYETKFKWFDKTLFGFSLLGNILSIFFAYFLLFPLLNKMIGTHVATGSISTISSFVLTIAFLSMFELIKREVIKVFSIDFVKFNYRINNYTMLIIGILIAGFSYFISIKGAIEFSKTSTTKNIDIKNDVNKNIDSLVAVYNLEKTEITQEINNIRESNKDLRSKRDNAQYRSQRTEFTNLISENEKLIESNLLKVDNIDKKINEKTIEIKKNAELIIGENNNEDSNNIFIFFIISTLIEIAIIFGVFFRQKYEYQSYFESKGKLDLMARKKEVYETLLKIVYKNGEVNADDQIISLSKLTEMMKSKNATLYNAKNIKEFYDDMTQLNVFKMVSNKRFTIVNYDEAKKQLETIDQV